MNETTDTDLRRFLRSTRIALATALAGHELASHRAMAPVARFGALAAKGPDGWHFPAGGLLSHDGLALAEVERDGAGRPARLVLQAQGVAGLDALAGRALTVAFGVVEVPFTFDRGGRGEIDLQPLGLAEEELADFSLGTVDGTP